MANPRREYRPRVISETAAAFGAELLEVAQIPGDTVLQSPLEMVPDEFIRVEFRSVAGEAMGVEPRIPEEKLLDRAPLVETGVIPEKNHGAAPLLEQLSEESSHLRGTDIFIRVKPGIEGDAPAFGGDTEGRDGRDFLPTTGTPQNRGLPSGRPGSGDVGNKQKAALIQEDQMGPRSFGVFLYAATGTASNARWPLRFAPRASSPVSDSSTRGPSAITTGVGGIADPELSLDHLGDPALSPQVRGITGSQGPPQEDSRQPPFLTQG